MADLARLLLGVVALTACTCKGKSARRDVPLRVDTHCTTNAAKAKPENPERQLAEILGARASIESIAPLLAAKVETVDDFVVAVFPSVRGKTLVDRPPVAPSTFTGKINPDFEARPISFPVDWKANPLQDISWQLWFQSLSWLRKADLDTSAYVILDWVENALNATPPLEFTWSDHPMGLRLRAALGFVELYSRREGSLDRNVLRAAAVIVVTHVLGLASSSCYTRNHNHGLLQDVALLEYHAGYAGMRDAKRLRELAVSRAKKQIESSVKPDGVHIENSPHYHAFYTDLILRVLTASRVDTSEPDPELRAMAGRVLAVHLQLLQPNHTFPQFGDTTNAIQTKELTRLVKKARELKVDEIVISELEWIATRGASGVRPRAVDAVFREGGYAAFRSGWTPDDQAVSGHFRTGHWGRAHYHPDDTGIEIYGFGTELVISSGIHGYDAKDPFAGYQYTPAAHNVLVIDELAVVDRKPHHKSRIGAHDAEGELVWVQGSSANYEKLGIEIVRTFAFRKPDAFIVVDHVEADGKEHRYAQHFHLHPTLSAVRQTGNTVIAQTADGKGATITFTTSEAATVDIARGVREPKRIAGWHFPNKYEEQPATQLAFQRKDERRELALPVLILVAPPGSRARIPDRLTYTEADGSLTLSWSENGRKQTIQVPLPPT